MVLHSRWRKFVSLARRLPFGHSRYTARYDDAGVDLPSRLGLDATISANAVDIDGESSGDDLNTLTFCRGETVTIGRFNDSRSRCRYVRVYRWRRIEPVQGDIDGESSGDYWVCTLTFCTTVKQCIGARFNDGAGIESLGLPARSSQVGADIDILVVSLGPALGLITSVTQTV